MSHPESLEHASMVLAKTYSIYFLVVGLALVVDPTRFRAWYEDILAENRRVMFGGTISLVIGCFILAFHPYWKFNWQLILTLIGVWGVFSGAGCLIWKDFIKLFKGMINANDLVYRLSGVFWAALGAFLGYQSYFSS